MKAAAVLLLLLISAGCIGYRETYISNGYKVNGVVKGYKVVAKVVMDLPEGEVRVPCYEIGAYKPDPNKYGMQCYDGNEVRAFLSAMEPRFSNNSVIAVDRLHWRMGEYGWEPFSEDPIPSLEEGEDKQKHFMEYAKWIDSHPHFGYPPLPLPGKL